MTRAVAILLASLLLIAAAPPPRRTIDDCERTASRAACDPRTGYIAGPSGPCRPSDLRCIEREWVRRGQPIYYPDLGICGRNHEDGGTVVACPPGTGPGGAGSPSRSGSRPPSDRDRDSGADRDRGDDRRRGGERGNRDRTVPGRGTPRRTPPPEPPPPPTTDEAVRTCPGLPTPRLHRNPDGEGVTGMATWLWADAHATVRGTTSIRGYPVTCTAVPEQWTWHTGDGAAYSRTRPGEEPPAHAAEHTYDRKGDYTQRLVVRWRLETNYGSGSAHREATRPYTVVEVRGALVE